MGAKGLTREIIVAEAVAYIEENGQPGVSLHEIARRLGIKTPSLYNHIKNTKELQYEIFQYAIDKFVSNQLSATKDKKKDEAVKAFAEAYHSFAIANKGLYRLIMSIPSEDDDRGKEMAVPLLDTVVSILSDYDLSEETIAHWQRVFRAILHGFISQEYLGYFYYYNSIDLKKSCDIAIQCFLDGLHAEMCSRNLE
jgi:AcrR family transcriptional regulator